ncbi:MAG: hypothetical protein R3247_10745 [Rhodothermales bacterium]|nr:hypothetical protein [Rhodothermales bacterium]
MEPLTCKTCGARSMIPVEVALPVDEQDDFAPLLGDEPESRFYSCQVCGDNWLSVREHEAAGACKITFVHQMGMSPSLKRIARLHNPVPRGTNRVRQWTYLLDDQEIDGEVWMDKLRRRRHVLRCICTN